MPLFRTVKITYFQPKPTKRKVGGQATSMKIIVWNAKLMSVSFIVRPTLLSRVLVNVIQAIFFILLVPFSFSFLAKKKKKMNKLSAWFIVEEKLETWLSIFFYLRDFFDSQGFSFFISYLKFFDSNFLLRRIMFKIINYRFFKTSLIVGFC